ncbi:MAG: prolyl oligopeptidase family serine peptidase, partial [Silvibacterium sp.]
MSLNTASLEREEEIIHNTRVLDPYRWLEDRQSPSTQIWINDQKLRCDDYFSTRRGLKKIRARIEEYLNVEVLDQPTQVGDLLFFRRRTRDQEQGCLCVEDLRNGQDRELVDPSSAGPFRSVGLHYISSDGSFLAYETRDGGQDMVGIGVVHVPSGNILPDAIPSGYARGFTFASDGSGFYYCHEVPGDRSDHRICFHKVGQPIDEADSIVFSVPRSASSRLVLASDSVHLGAIYFYSLGSDIAADFFLASRKRDSEWSTVFRAAMAPYAPMLTRGRIFIFTRSDAGASRLIEITKTGRVLRETVPEWKTDIHELAFAGDRVYAEYRLDQTTVVRSWTLEGQSSDCIDLPASGTVHLLPCFADQTDALFYSHESFATPLVIYRYHPASGLSSSWPKETTRDKTPGCTTRRVHLSSMDGAQIPMCLVANKHFRDDVPRPTIMTSYGGFGVSMTSQFSVFVAVMLALGAVFAMPSIRGGSEFGKEWYEAARGKNRQVAFDDFIAGAQWLCDRQITTREQLAIFGGSNSGLLVGVAMTQRPDLFRAVLCIAPLLDMVRYERFDEARKWRFEYGTVEERDEFASLYAYSPYHHVQEAINYPATLFVAGDKDTRCNPAHVRKMAALLQGRSAQSSAILVDYSSERGHSATLPL